MRHGLRVLRAFLSLGVLNLVQYRSDFFIALLNALISLVTQVLALSVVFTATSDLRGWGPNDLLVLVGIHFFITGLIGIVMRPSMEALMEGIRLGTFDFLLTKPADSQLLASVQTVAPQAATDVVIGVGVVAYGMTRLGVTFSPLDVALFLVMLLAGLQSIPNNLYELYATEFGVTIGRAREKLKAVAAGPEEAPHLGVPAGTPLLRVDRQAFALDGRLAEWRVSLCRTDDLHYSSDLR